uniref:Uncharacterized protein n=1 Tax=Rhizophora mucronata TaxID=61149 RepID=A0A2P2IV69_RHIMU
MLNWMLREMKGENSERKTPLNELCIQNTHTSISTRDHTEK